MLPYDVRRDIGNGGIAYSRNEVVAANIIIEVEGHVVDLFPKSPPLVRRRSDRDTPRDDERPWLLGHVVEETFHRAAHHDARPDQRQLPLILFRPHGNAGYGIIRRLLAKRGQFRPPVAQRAFKRRVAEFVEARKMPVKRVRRQLRLPANLSKPHGCEAAFFRRQFDCRIDQKRFSTRVFGYRVSRTPCPRPHCHFPMSALFTYILLKIVRSV